MNKKPATTMVRGKRGTLHLEFNPFRAVSSVAHGIFTRVGGQSGAPFGSLNVGLSTGDDRQMVKENRKIVAETLGGSPCIYLNQVHSDTVIVLRGDRDSHTRDTVGIQSGDALVTDIPDLTLVIQVADCQPVLLVDPVKEVVAAIHSGWKGSISNIIGKSVEIMHANFGSDPGNILAGIGPSLGPCCSEFINYPQEIPEQLWSYKDEKDHFDFWRISQDQLINKGIPPSNITLAGICTKCSANTFFSYRDNNTTGRFAAAIKILGPETLKTPWQQNKNNKGNLPPRRG